MREDARESPRRLAITNQDCESFTNGRNASPRPTLELARQRELLTADGDILAKTRATFEAHQSAETERLMTWENMLVDRAAELTRRANDLTDERDVLGRDRVQFQDDLIRLERRSATIEEKERATEEREREVAVRLEQMKRDAAEWEETIAIAASEQDRLRQEAERLDRQKTGTRCSVGGPCPACR